MYQQRETVCASLPKTPKCLLMKVSRSFYRGFTINLFHPLSPSAPVIVEFPEDTRVQEGEGVVLKVEVTGVPHPKLTWYHDGVEVVPDYSRELAEDGTLTLPSAETKHSGVYQLVARNRGGSAEREVKLQVEQEGVEEGIAAEEPSYETVALSGPVPVAVFGSHVEQRHSKNNKPFKEEYEVGL